MVCEKEFGSDVKSWFAEHPRTKRTLALGAMAFTLIAPTIVSRLVSNDPSPAQLEWIECADDVANVPQGLTPPEEFIVSNVVAECGQPPESQ